MCTARSAHGGCRSRTHVRTLRSAARASEPPDELTHREILAEMEVLGEPSGERAAGLADYRIMSKFFG